MGNIMRSMLAAVGLSVLTASTLAAQQQPPHGQHGDSTKHAGHGAHAGHAAHAGHGGTQQDSAFAALQVRGAAAMGVDQYTSTHVFEPLPDGGRIELQRDVEDPDGVAVIRAHLQDIARQFAAGDFAIPGVVHAREVPGTRVMAAQAANIRYTFRSLPRGGEVLITTSAPAAIAAVHEFLAFQRSDHRAH